MSDKLDDIINSSFSNGENESAPDFVWGGVNDYLDNSSVVDAKVKSSFESANESAPEMVWDKVQDQLDIDRAWVNIVNRITLPRRKRILAYACSVLLLFLPFVLDHNSIETNPTGLISEEITNYSESGSELNSPNSDSDKSIVRPIKSDKPLLDFVDLYANQSAQVNQTNKPGSNAGLNIDPSTIPSLISVEIDGTLETLALEPILLARNDVQPSLLNPRRPIVKRNLGITIGGVGSLCNSWVIDNDTRNGFDPESIVENKFSLASSYGAFVDVKIGRRYSIQGEYLFQSKTRQLTQLYIDGEYTLKEREINAYKIVLMASRNFEPKSAGLKHSTSIRFGGYLSGVKSDFTRYNDVLLKFNSIYKRNDIGLRFEIAKKIHLKSFSIEGGIKGEYGLLNLAPYQDKTPPHLNFTRTASVGAFIKLGYSF